MKWKPVVGWEGLYEVSDQGGIRSLTRTGITKFGVREYKGADVHAFLHKSTGYLAVNLTRRGVRTQQLVHMLVLAAFIGPRPKGGQTRHLNGQRSDNRLENLAWGTALENAQDKRAHGTLPIGSMVHNARLNEDQVRRARKERMTAGVIAREFGVSKGCADNVRSGNTWRHVTP
jgi:hypothetical protein